MLKQKLGVSKGHESAQAAVCMCACAHRRRRQSSYSALSKQRWDYPIFHSQTIIRPKCPLRRGRPATQPGARRGRVGAKGGCVWLWCARKNINLRPCQTRAIEGVLATAVGWRREEGSRERGKEGVPPPSRTCFPWVCFPSVSLVFTLGQGLQLSWKVCFAQASAHLTCHKNVGHVNSLDWISAEAEKPPESPHLDLGRASSRGKKKLLRPLWSI